VSRNKLDSEQVSNVIDPFINFVKILQINTLLEENSKEILTNLLNCISVVVIKADDES
jgi:hypothetical protein